MCSRHMFEEYGLLVDNFYRPKGTERDRELHFFLTHVHGDHTEGLTKTGWKGGELHCSSGSARLLGEMGYDLKPKIWKLRTWKRVKEGVEAACVEANHCYGSVMWLFRFSNDQKIVYTGDYRLSPDTLKWSGWKKVIPTTSLMYDSTYHSELVSVPTFAESLEAFSNILNEHGRLAVFVQSVGTESFVGWACKRFGKTWNLDHKSLKTHVFEMTMKPFAKYRNRDNPDILIVGFSFRDTDHDRVLVKPGAKWSLCFPRERNPSKDERGVYRLNLSMHASYRENIALFAFLRPKHISQCSETGIPKRPCGAADRPELFTPEDEQMHWLTIVLVAILSILVVALIVLFGFMLANRPSEMDQLADQPGFGELRNSHSRHRKPHIDLRGLGNNMSNYEVRLSSMNDGDLQRELMRIINAQGTATDSSTREPEETERDDRASQILTAITNSSRGAADDAPSPYTGEGDGIVICAGGFVYGTCAHVLLKSLRSSGCTLPVEIWHRNDEMSEDMRSHFESFENVDVRNIDQVSSITFKNQFAIKPLSVFYSKFRRVLLLDADNLVFKDPTYLFEKLSDDVSAIFWPDVWPLDKKARCYAALSAEQLSRMTWSNVQDSGQLLVDKQYGLNAVGLCAKIVVQMHTQLTRMFPGPYNTGDKDVWNYAFLVTDTNFQMLSDSRPSVAGTRNSSGEFIGTTIVHYDNEHEPVFLHKLWAKWATQTQKPQWTEIQRFLNSQRGSVNAWTKCLENGAVVRTSFVETFGDIEEACWSALGEIRQKEWYRAQFSSEIKDMSI